MIISIEQIERDLENLQKEKYEYQQKVKEALEANIENAKRFEEQVKFSIIVIIFKFINNIL